jgi:hypothetical protein
MSDREAFEKWSIENGYDVTRGKYPNYTYNTTQQRWEGFKAGLQHPPEGYVLVPMEDLKAIKDARKNGFDVTYMEHYLDDLLSAGKGEK